MASHKLAAGAPLSPIYHSLTHVPILLLLLTDGPRDKCFTYSFVSSHQLVASRGDALFDGFDDGPLLEYGALAVAFGLVLESIAYIGDVDHPSLVQLMSDDEVPCGTGCIQPVAVGRCDDTVAGCLVRVERQHVAVKVGGVVLEGSRHGWSGAIAGRATAL